MDFDREMELENAGIDAFEFSMMDEDERRQALEDAFLDPDDYDLIEYDTSFSAWSNLQDAGLSLSELAYMDEDEKRETLRDAGLDPDDYEVYPPDTPSYTHHSAPNPVNTDKYIPPVFPKIVPVEETATTEPAIKAESPVKMNEGKCSETLKAEPAPKTERKAENKSSRLAITIITIFVLSCAFLLVYSKVQEDRRKEAEAQAIRQAEEMYIQGLSQFSKENYEAAYKSFNIAKAKNIEESNAYYYYSVGMDYAASKNYDNAESSIRKGINAAISTKTMRLGKQLLNRVETEHTAYDKQQEKEYLQNLAKSLPYVGMSEKYINNTALGRPSSTVRHNHEMVNGQSLLANLYDYTSNGYVIFTARCVNGVVTDVFDDRAHPYKPSSSSSSSSSSKKSSSSTKKSDPFHASDYAHPDDFYYDNYDDFWDYEDAEDYWEAHH